MFFFLPLLAHVLSALSCVIFGIVAFRMPKRQGSHPHWGRYYLWAYTLVFLTATILSFERWQTDAYLFFTALVAYGLALIGYTARRMRRNTRVPIMLRKRWLSIHILGMTGSYIGLLTAFFVDNANQIPLLDRLPQLTFWFIPGAIGVPFLLRSLSRYAPNKETARATPLMKRKESRDNQLSEIERS